MAARTSGGGSGARKVLVGCAVAAVLGFVVLSGVLLVGGRRAMRPQVAMPSIPPVPQRPSQAPWEAARSSPKAWPSTPTGPLRIDEEAVGFTSEEGYDYPDRNAGNVVCNKRQARLRVLAIARPPEPIGGSWILVSSQSCPRAFWASSVAWLHGDPEGLPTVTDLPPLRWPEPSSLPSVEKARGRVVPAIGDSVEGRSAPGTAGTTACVLPRNSEVRALACVESDLLEVLVRAPACPSPVWIQMTAVKWTGVEWWDLNDRLPAVRAGLAGPPWSPKIAGPAPTSAASAPRVAPGMPARVFVRNTKGGEHPWHRALPDAWRARRPDEAALVATVRPAPELVERCTYIPMGVVYRVRPGYSITLSLTDMSRVVARTSVLGAPPAPCPGSVSVKIGGQNDPWQLGEEPRAAAAVAWLEPFALGSH